MTIFTPLAGGGSTVDIGTARGNELDPKVLAGKVLAYDDFEAGFGRWADHISGNHATSTARNPMSLTSERALSGSQSLLIAARSQPAGVERSTWRHYSNGSYNRLSRDFPITETGWRYLDFSLHLALGGTTSRAFSAFQLYCDTQEWTLPADWNTSHEGTYKGRSYYAVACRLDPATGLLKWSLGNQSLSVFTDVASTVGGVAAPGFNEDKRNDVYVRVTFDMWANGKQGRYHSMQVADQTIDLAPLGIKPKAEPPQYSNDDPNRSFAGGLNPGISIQAADPTITGHEAGEAWAIVDQTVVSIRKAA